MVEGVQQGPVLVGTFFMHHHPAQQPGSSITKALHGCYRGWFVTGVGASLGLHSVATCVSAVPWTKELNERALSCQVVGDFVRSSGSPSPCGPIR